MNAPTNLQIIYTEDRKPAFVLVPYEQFQRMSGGFVAGAVPNAVVTAVFDSGLSPIRAWRDYLRLTQNEVAERMGVSQAAFAQLERSKRPRKTTLKKAASALGISPEQIDF